MENELKTNAVKLSPDEQYQIRKSIVRLSKTGKTNGEIAEILDLRQHCTIFEQCCLNMLFDLLPFEKTFFAKHT